MESVELIQHATRVIGTRKGAPKQVDLRRAISAAYYALFHYLLRAVADDLIGKSAAARKSPSYALAYRSLGHAQIRRMCEEATKPNLPEKLKAVLGIGTFPPEIQYVANVFAQLQDLRHEADYHPQARFGKSDALGATAKAEFAITQFSATNETTRRLFLHLMLFRAR